MVLLDEVHGSFCEEIHVDANEEALVTSCDLLVVDNHVANSVSDPLSVSSVCKLVF